MSVITNSHMRTTTPTLAAGMAAPVNQSPSWNLARITTEIQGATSIKAVMKIWENHSASFDLGLYATAFTKINAMKGERTISKTKRVDVLKKMVENAVKILSKNEPTTAAEKIVIREIIKSTS